MRWVTLLNVSIGLICILGSNWAYSAERTDNTKRYTAAVYEKLELPAEVGFHLWLKAPENPIVCTGTLALGTAMAGTLAGQMISFGIAKWWDPTIEVFPNAPGNVVTSISRQEILAMADEFLWDAIGLQNPAFTFDAQAMNQFSPGLGDAAEELLVSSVRAFAHTAQGAAAFAEQGSAGPSVLQAATLLNDDLVAYRRAMTDFAPFLDELEPIFAGLGSPIPVFTATDYLNYLADVQMNGAAALPVGERPLGDRIFALANVHMEGTTLADSIVEYLSSGDTAGEAAEFPIGGYTPRILMETADTLFNIDAFTLEIAAAPTLGLQVNTVTGIVLLSNPTDEPIAFNSYDISSASGSLNSSNGNVFEADFDKDEVVDGDDLLIWQSNSGAQSGATSNNGDTDDDGDVDGHDFLVWQRQSGSTAAGGGWHSLSDQGFVDWLELWATQNLIGEDNAFGDLTLDVDETINLGRAFNTDGIQDLAFEYFTPEGLLVNGFVQYVSELQSVPEGTSGCMLIIAILSLPSTRNLSFRLYEN